MCASSTLKIISHMTSNNMISHIPLSGRHVWPLWPPFPGPCDGDDVCRAGRRQSLRTAVIVTTGHQLVAQLQQWDHVVA